MVEVWSTNLEEEFRRLREIVEEYPVVAMDTEFPGVVARPLQTFKSASEYHYQSLKANCDLLKIIQLGITLFNERGERRPGVCTWQFNFRFALKEDMFAEDSITLLQQAGLDFAQHEQRGIEMEHFGELIMTSGLVLMDEVKWVSFHGAYDFGYLVKILTSSPLPKQEQDFLRLLHDFFPNLYDLKYMLLSAEGVGGSLQRVAEELGVRRIGTEHQAGSDSQVTGEAFFAAQRRFFRQLVEEERFADKFSGLLYQLGDLNPQERQLRRANSVASSSASSSGRGLFS